MKQFNAGPVAASAQRPSTSVASNPSAASHYVANGRVSAPSYSSGSAHTNATYAGNSNYESKAISNAPVYSRPATQGRVTPASGTSFPSYSAPLTSSSTTSAYPINSGAYAQASNYAAPNSVSNYAPTSVSKDTSSPVAYQTATVASPYTNGSYAPAGSNVAPKSYDPATNSQPGYSGMLPKSSMPNIAPKPAAPTATTSTLDSQPAASQTNSTAAKNTSGTEKPKRKNSRIDPRQIPRPVTYPPPEKDKPAPNNARLVYKASPPPVPSTTAATAGVNSSTNFPVPPCPYIDFYVEDLGNCSPKFMRPTCWNVPNTQDLVDESHLGLSVVVQPLASSPLDEPVPLVPPMGDPSAPNPVDRDTPIRCARCAAYMNPFNVFEDRGKTWRCSLCFRSNDVPHHYMAHLDENGLRRDRLDRPELHRGSYDISVPSFAGAKSFQNPSFLFVIDVSFNSISSHFLDSAVQAITGSLPYLLEKYPTCQVGIMTFDSRIQFYTLWADAREPRMVVAASPKEGFAVLPPSKVLVPLADEKCWDHINTLLGNLTTWFGNSTPKPACFGAACAAAASTMESVGGRILMLTCSIAGVGQGKLEDREDSKLVGTPQETKSFGPQDAFYQILATKMAENLVSIDLFVGANAYVDLATTSVLSRTTGGQVYYYTGFQFAKDGYALENDIYRALTRVTGFEGVLVMRTSTGLKVVEDFGNFFRRNAGEIDLPVIDSDKALVIRIAHEGTLATNQTAVFQCAMLYTSDAGDRRIRVHNLSLPITPEISKVFRHADVDAIINVSMRQVINHIHGSSTVDTRKMLREAAVEILHIYRKRCASNTSSGQLILPEALKLLPLFTLGMIKNGSLADYTPVDDRMYLFNIINMMPLPLSVPLCSPRLFALHKLPENACVWEEDGSFLLPELEIVSTDFLDDFGVYLLDSGLLLTIWIGSNVTTDVVYELFGQESLEGVDLYSLAVFPTEDPHSLASKTSALIEYLRMNRPIYANLRVLVQNRILDSLDERRFLNSLIEDSKELLKGEKALGSDSDRMSYVDFLCYLHRKIQDKFI